MGGPPAAALKPNMRIETILSHRKTQHSTTVIRLLLFILTIFKKSLLIILQQIN